MTKNKTLSEAAALCRAIHDFCWDWAPNQLTSSANTLRSHRTAVELYLLFLESEGVTPSGLTAADLCAPRIESFLRWLERSRGCKPQTCNVRLASIRALCRYVSRTSASFAHLEVEAASVGKREAPKAKVRGLTRDAVSALSHAPGASTAQGRRDTALIVTLYATACRVGELLALRVRDLTLGGSSPHAEVTGKGGKPRVVHLPDKAVAHLRAHLGETLGDSPDGDAYVFWSPRHRPGERPLTADSVTKMLQRHARAAHASCPDLPEDVTPHRLRHARATHWLDDGMSVAQVSLLLGHASIKTTMDYLDITMDAKADALKVVTGVPEPVAKWKGHGAASLLATCGFGGA